jgi:hypothetical protein
MGFTFRLEHDDGTPADPPTLKAEVPTWPDGRVTVCAFFATAPVWTNPSMRAPPSETAANVEST